MRPFTTAIPDSVATDAETTAAVAAHTGDAEAAHAASAVSAAPGGVRTGDTAQEQLDELDAAKVTHIGTFAAPIDDPDEPRPNVAGPVYWIMDTGITPNNAENADQIWREGDSSATVETVTHGDGIKVDNTDPENPIIELGVYVWDGDSYELLTGRIFVGPADPDDNGFTMADGDMWKDTGA